MQITIDELLESLRMIPQDATHHPEGHVLEHTYQVMQQVGRIAYRDKLSAKDTYILYLSAKFHDVGKIKTTRIVTEQGKYEIDDYFLFHPNERIVKITSYGHAQESAMMAIRYLADIEPTEVIMAVAALCDTHMNYDISTAKAIRKLQLKLQAAHTNLSLWAALVEADHSGRHPLPPSAPANAVLELAKGFGIPIV